MKNQLNFQLAQPGFPRQRLTLTESAAAGRTRKQTIELMETIAHDYSKGKGYLLVNGKPVNKRILDQFTLEKFVRKK